MLHSLRHCALTIIKEENICNILAKPASTYPRAQFYESPHQLKRETLTTPSPRQLSLPLKTTP